MYKLRKWLLACLCVIIDSASVNFHVQAYNGMNLMVGGKQLILLQKGKRFIHML